MAANIRMIIASRTVSSLQLMTVHEGQNVNAEDELTACSTDNESERSDKCLDLNDPKVIKTL